jgi:hypothetical protein
MIDMSSTDMPQASTKAQAAGAQAAIAACCESWWFVVRIR